MQIQLFIFGVDWNKYKQTNEVKEKSNEPIEMLNLK